MPCSLIHSHTFAVNSRYPANPALARTSSSASTRSEYSRAFAFGTAPDTMSSVSRSDAVESRTWSGSLPGVTLGIAALNVSSSAIRTLALPRRSSRPSIPESNTLFVW